LEEYVLAPVVEVVKEETPATEKPAEDANTSTDEP